MARMWLGLILAVLVLDHTALEWLGCWQSLVLWVLPLVICVFLACHDIFLGLQHCCMYYIGQRVSLGKMAAEKMKTVMNKVFAK